MICDYAHIIKTGCTLIPLYSDRGCRVLSRGFIQVDGDVHEAALVFEMLIKVNITSLISGRAWRDKQGMGERCKATPVGAAKTDQL